MRRIAILAILAAAWLGLAGGSAQANRTLLQTDLLHPDPEIPAPPPDGQVEGACGLALSAGRIYVSDYYHRAVDAFAVPSGGPTAGRIALPGTNPVFGVNTLDSVCGLALGPGEALYANEWHQGVLRLTPSEQVFDEGESTGVAVDAAGNVYANDRTHIAVYEPSGDPVEVGGEPLLIGGLVDGFGLAVSTVPATAGHVYAADAATGNVKVFDPSGNPSIPTGSRSP